MSAILFDFFGTLVSYSPSRVDQGYPRCHAFLREHGSALSYDDFLARVEPPSTRAATSTTASSRWARSRPSFSPARRSAATRPNPNGQCGGNHCLSDRSGENRRGSG
jgi:hypothetical protein